MEKLKIAENIGFQKKAAGQKTSFRFLWKFGKNLVASTPVFS